MTECVNFYTSAEKFSDMMTVYAVDFMKLSCADIRDVVFDAFGGLCIGGTYLSP